MADLIDPHHTRRDLRMIETAISKGWTIPDQLMTALPKVAGALAINGEPREQIAAMQVLLKMKSQNDQQQIARATIQQQTINVGVNVSNELNSGRSLASTVLARIRAGEFADAIPGPHAGPDSEAD